MTEGTMKTLKRDIYADWIEPTSKQHAIDLSQEIKDRHCATLEEIRLFRLEPAPTTPETVKTRATKKNDLNNKRYICERHLGRIRTIITKYHRLENPVGSAIPQVPLPTDVKQLQKELKYARWLVHRVMAYGTVPLGLHRDLSDFLTEQESE